MGRKIFALFVKKTGNQTECADFCSEKGGSLPAVLSDAENAQLAWQMLHYGVSKTWIGLLPKSYLTTVIEKHLGKIISIQ